MDKTRLRIYSKIGLLVVIIGFFMPVSCNLNGFQLAKYASSFGQLNLLSLGLYGIFLFSCLGSILLLLLAMKMRFSMNWDWVAVIGVITSAVIVFIQTDGGNTGFGGNMFQSGAYVMLFGMIGALVFLIPVSDKDKKKPVKSSTLPEIQTNDLKKTFCPQCGNKLKEGYNFCSTCGAKIQD